MTNIYIFWKETSDPPGLWSRLTRTNQYLRCSSSTANHWTDVGSTTHTHSSVSSFSCGNSLPSKLYTYNPTGTVSPMASHAHSAPASWTISSASNTPLGYGLDVIYMDADYWETYEKRFPDGSVILSNGALTDTGYISRFASCDGYYIYNAAPGSTTGSSSHYHTVSGTLANNTSSGGLNCYFGSGVQAHSIHNHTVSLNSGTSSQDPVTIVTRLYEILLETSKAVSGSVAFFDDTPSSNWSVLTSWNGANIKSGNSNPTISGSDTHTQTISGNTSTNGSSNNGAEDSGGTVTTSAPHYHAVTGTLSSSSHIPYSKYLTPAVLLSTVYHPIATSRPQIIGLSAW